MLLYLLQQNPPVLARLILPLGLLLGLFLILQRRARGGDFRENTPKNIKEVDLTTPETTAVVPLHGNLPLLYVFCDFKTFEPKLSDFLAAYILRWQKEGRIQTVDENTLRITGEPPTDDPFAKQFWQVLVTAQDGADALTVDTFRASLENSALVTQRVFGGFAAKGLDLAVEKGLVTVEHGKITKKVYLTETGKTALQNVYAYDRYLDKTDLNAVPLDILTAFGKVPNELRETPAWQAAFNFGFTAHAVYLSFIYRARLQQGGG